MWTDEFPFYVHCIDIQVYHRPNTVVYSSYSYWTGESRNWIQWKYRVCEKERFCCVQHPRPWFVAAYCTVVLYTSSTLDFSYTSVFYFLCWCVGVQLFLSLWCSKPFSSPVILWRGMNTVARRSHTVQFTSESEERILYAKRVEEVVSDMSWRIVRLYSSCKCVWLTKNVLKNVLKRLNKMAKVVFIYYCACMYNSFKFIKIQYKTANNINQSPNWTL